VPWGGVYRSPASSTSPTYFTLVTSDRGDALELCDADGAAFAAYRYGAWGLPQGEGSFATGVWTQSTTLVTSSLAGQIASRQILRYAGYAFDSESGLYYCSARYYDPATRQWTTGDPAKADGEESAYQYCSGDPVGMIDLVGDYPGPPHRPRTALRLKAYLRARSLVGKDMRGAVTSWYGEPRSSAWCAMAVTYIYKHVGSKAFDPAKKRWAYVPWIVRDAAPGKDLGLRLLTRSQARRGDLVVFDFDSPGPYNHVGILASKANGTTIEGNTGALPRDKILLIDYHMPDAVKFVRVTK